MAIESGGGSLRPLEYVWSAFGMHAPPCRSGHTICFWRPISIHKLSKNQSSTLLVVFYTYMCKLSISHSIARCPKLVEFWHLIFDYWFSFRCKLLSIIYLQIVTIFLDSSLALFVPFPFGQDGSQGFRQMNGSNVQYMSSGFPNLQWLYRGRRLHTHLRAILVTFVWKRARRNNMAPSSSIS